MKRFLLGLALVLGLFSSPALAQKTALVVSSCGTLPDTYAAGQVRYQTIDTNGNLCSLLGAASTAIVTGNVASGATDSGNPVKVGGPFLTASPTVTNGQRVDWQFSANGDGSVAVQGTSLAPGDGNSNTALLLANKSGTAVKVLNWAQVYNGTTWDKQRSVGVGDAGSTGITAAGQYIFNGTTWDRWRGGPYQLAQTQVLGIGTGTTGAVTGTLAGAASKTTFICGFDISATGGVASLGPITVTGLLGGTFTYQLFSTATGVNFTKTYNPCLQASAVNTAIVVTTTADGTATAVDVNVQGFQQ